jgi:hypothetical protein
VAADPIGRDLKAILEKSKTPTYQRDLPQWNVLVFQVAVPGKRHKDVGENQQDNCDHRCSYPIPRSEEDSSGVPQTRQITAEQSPQVSGSAISRAQLGQ